MASAQMPFLVFSERSVLILEKNSIIASATVRDFSSITICPALSILTRSECRICSWRSFEYFGGVNLSSEPQMINVGVLISASRSSISNSLQAMKSPCSTEGRVPPIRLAASSFRRSGVSGPKAQSLMVLTASGKVASLAEFSNIYEATRKRLPLPTKTRASTRSGRSNAICRAMALPIECPTMIAAGKVSASINSSITWTYSVMV